MERELLAKLFQYDFYEAHKHRIDRDLFPSALQPLYDTIVKAHEKYKTDLTTAWIKRLHREYNPALTRSQRGALAVILDDIDHDDVPPDDLAADILRSVHKREKARAVAQAAVRIVNGEVDDFDILRDTIAGFDVSDSDDGDYNIVEFDMDALLTTTDPANLFGFRLPTLAEKVPGGGRGHQVIVFARTEIGKTAWAVFETAGFLKQGLKVVYFQNEEPSSEVYLRIVSSALEKTEAEILANPEEATKLFKPLAENLAMIDCVHMNINEVDKWCKLHSPDVVVLDQIDKFVISEPWQRDEERLGKLYMKTREIAKGNGVLTYLITQASADADGISRLQMHMMQNAKTAKQAEADLIIGIGFNEQLQETMETRVLCILKNKISRWHGYVTTLLDKERGVFNV